MKQLCKNRPDFKDLLRDRRGIVAVAMAASLPFFLGFLALAVDMGYAYWMRNLLQVTAESAALAATAQLPDNGPCTTTTSACYIAKKYAAYNMPAATYGPVLNTNNCPNSATCDAVVGRWTDSTKTFAALVQPFNAVKVTTRKAAANGNALNLFFAPVVGIANMDVSATAIATFGAAGGGAAQPTWDVIIVEDISSSFSQEIAQAKAADHALLDCVRDNAAAGSRVGLTVFTGTNKVIASALPVSTPANYTTVNNAITSLAQCGTGSMPNCSGSNAASGMNCATRQFGFTGTNLSCTNSFTAVPAPIPGSRRGMVIVTDGQPNCGSGSGSGCSNTTLRNNAVTAANTAASHGIDVSTIYYGNNNADATWLAGLVRGNGQALKTPNPAQISTLMYTLCASMPHRLVW